MTALVTAIFIIVAVIGFILAILGWRKWRVVDPLSPVPASPNLLIIGLVFIVIGLAGAGIIYLKQGFGPGREKPPEAEKPKPFSVVATSPADKAVVPRNAIVRVFFSQAVRPMDATRLRVVAVAENGELQPVPASVRIENEPLASAKPLSGSIVFQPITSCGGIFEKVGCFAAKQQYRVDFDAPRLRNFADNESLNCEGGALCSFTFTTSEAVDTKPPAITLSPTLDLPISERTLFTVKFNDDNGLSHLRITLDRGQADPHFVGFFPVPKSDASSVLINTANLGIINNSRRFLTVEIYDLAAHKTEMTTVTAFYASHCFNDQIDEGELGKDCGGVDCPACKR